MDKAKFIKLLHKATKSVCCLTTGTKAKLTAKPKESIDSIIRLLPESVFEVLKENTEYSNLTFTYVLQLKMKVPVVLTQVKQLRSLLLNDEPAVEVSKRHIFDHSLWCTSMGVKTAPKDMETKHIFSTIRLLWNSYMPRPLSIGTYKAVWFNPERYTSSYLTSIIKLLYAELESRDDLHVLHAGQLAHVQMDKLLAQVATQELVEQAVKEFEAREDKDFYVDQAYSYTWDSATAALDFT